MKILIVDDNVHSRKLVRITLESHGCEKIIEACDGQEGLDMVRTHRPDLIISDALMPRMDGFQFLRALKTDEEVSSIPFIFHSSVYTGMKDEELAFSLGAKAFITKSKAPEEFWRELAPLLNGLPAGEKSPSAGETVREEQGYLKEYGRVVAAKLEEKVMELEESLTRCEAVEKALKESRKFLSTIIETEPDCVKLLAADGTILMMNQSGLKLIGADCFDQVKGKSAYNLIDPGYREAFKTLTEDVFRGKSGNLVFKMIEIKEKNRWLDSHAVPLRNDAGEIVSLLAITRDITERKEAEDALIKLSQAVEQSPASIMISDLTGAIEFVNPKFSQTTGYAAEEVIGQNPRFLKSGETSPEEYRELWGTITSGNVWRGVFHNRNKNGELFWESAAISPLRNSEGVITHFLSVREDITHQKEAEEKIRRQVDKLAALRTIDKTISGSLDLRVTLSVFLEQTLKQLQVDAASVLLFRPHSQMLEYAAGLGFNRERIVATGLRLGQGYAGRAALERKSCIVPDIAATGVNLASTTLIEMEGFKAYVGVPLVAKGELKGVLEIFNRSTLNPDQEWLEFAEALSGQAAIALDNAEMFDHLQRAHSDLLTAYDITIEGWSRALDFRDRETEGHSRRVTETTIKLARSFGIGEEELVHIRRGALLHDIGKMGVRDSILLKTGPLTADEMTAMREHPHIAYKLLAPIAFLRPAIDIPYCHHEKWDGSGYPRGLAEEEIPFAARIFTVVDVWDALRSDRPYRAAWPEEQVRSHIRSLAGSAFDPRVVDTFLTLEV